MSDLLRWLANGHTIRWSGYSAAHGFVAALFSTIHRWRADWKRREAERRTAARRSA